MIYYMSILAYGDNLISLSLLAELKEKSRICIVGTGLTQSIASFVPGLEIPIIITSDKIPALYDFKKNGIVKVLEEGLSFLTNMPKLLNKEDAIIFEKRDLRNRLLLGSITGNIYEPERRRNIYEDRRDLLQTVLGERVRLKEAVGLHRMPQRVTINPASRLKEKTIPGYALGYLISYLKKKCMVVKLIDPDKVHLDLQNMVDSYHTDTSLAGAVELVEDCDLYIGADSLFMHFAYLYNVPFLILFNKLNLYFAPPGVRNSKNYIASVSELTGKQLCHALDGLFEGL